MGIKRLIPNMKETFIKGNLSQFWGKRVGIDSMAIIYKAHFACMSYDPIEKILSQVWIIENYLKVFKESKVEVN